MKSGAILERAMGVVAWLPSAIIPQAYRDEPSILNALYKWLLIGILARLIFMPIAFHGDLLSTYRRSYMLAFEGGFQYLNPHETVQALALKVFAYFTPLQEYLDWSGITTVSVSGWLGSLDNAEIFRTIFLLKTPYLFFDLLICLVILYIFRTEAQNGLRAFMFWFLNPIVIFAVYIFGRFEVIPIFFLLMSIYFIKENHLYLASLLLGVAIYDRFSMIFFLPLLLILGFDTWVDRGKALAVCLSPLFLLKALSTILAGITSSGGIVGESGIVSGGGANSIEYITSMAGSHFVDYILGMQLDIGHAQVIYIFIVAYVCIILGAWYSKRSNKIFQDFVAYSLIILLLFYATSVFHPHYFAWFIPFLALYYGFMNDTKLIELHCLQVICFVFFTFYWHQALATWMFASIYPEILIQMPPPIEIIDNYYSPGLTIVNMARSALTAVSLFMVAKILINRAREVFPNEG